jgi:hypothetical protein
LAQPNLLDQLLAFCWGEFWQQFPNMVERCCLVSPSGFDGGGVCGELTGFDLFEEVWAVAVERRSRT